jgi:hypothetical protein
VNSANRSELCLAALTLAMATLLTVAPAGSAHGPCSDCTTPKRGRAGTTVRVKWTAVKVVWNPSRRQDPYGQIQDVYHPTEPSVTIFVSKRPRKTHFRVPRDAPGRYGIAIYDGSEGGGHYTWSYFTIRPRVAPTASAVSRRPGAWAWIAGGAGALVVVLVSAAAVRAGRMRQRGRPRGA